MTKTHISFIVTRQHRYYVEWISPTMAPGDRKLHVTGGFGAIFFGNAVFMRQKWEKIKEMLIFKSCLLSLKMLY